MANTHKRRRIVPLWIVLVVTLAAVAVAVALLLLPGIRNKVEPPSELQEIGNAGGNLTNGGTALACGGDVILTGEDGGLLRVQPGQTTGSSVGGLRGSYLNARDRTLWYIDADAGALMRSDQSGAEPTVVVSGRVTRLTLFGDYLYFVDVDKNYALCRIHIKPDSPVELLSAARVMQYAIVGQRIFYRDLNEEDFCWCMGLDGSDARALDFRVGQVLFAQGNRLYCSDPERGGALNYCEPSGDGDCGDPIPLDTGTVTCSVADADALYYTSAEDGKLYAFDLDGSSGKRLLLDAPVYGLQNVPGFIYYRSVADGGQWGAVAKN